MDTAALRTSWATVAERSDEAAELFYAVLFTLAPEPRAMFPVAMGAQRDKLLTALGHIVSHVDDPNTIAGFVTQLGRDHCRFAVADQHYPIVGRVADHAATRVGPGPDTGFGPGLDAGVHAGVPADDRRCASGGRVRAGLVGRRRGLRGPADRAHHRGDRGATPALPLPAGAARCNGMRPATPGLALPVSGERHADEQHDRVSRPGRTRRSGQPSTGVQPPGRRSPQTRRPVGTALARAHITVRDLLLIAGGTGLAPLRSIVEHLAGSPVHDRVSLVVGAQTMADLLRAEGLEPLQVRPAFLVGAQQIVHCGLRLAPGTLAGADTVRVVSEHAQVNHEQGAYSPRSRDSPRYRPTSRAAADQRSGVTVRSKGSTCSALQACARGAGTASGRRGVAYPAGNPSGAPVA